MDEESVCGRRKRKLMSFIINKIHDIVEAM
jgi:hypothetical protein